MSMTWIHECSAYKVALEEAREIMKGYGAPAKAIAEIDRLYLQAEEVFGGGNTEDGSEDFDSEDPPTEEGSG